MLRAGVVSATVEAACSFAANLRGLRDAREMTVGHAAAQVGVAKATWSQWESGKRFPAYRVLDRIARRFDVRPCELLRDGPCVCTCLPAVPGGSAQCFAKRMILLRRTRGLSNKTAAARLGVSAATWSQWESGKRFPRVWMLEDIALLFNEPLCRLIGALPERSCACGGCPGPGPEKARP